MNANEQTTELLAEVRKLESLRDYKGILRIIRESDDAYVQTDNDMVLALANAYSAMRLHDEATAILSDNRERIFASKDPTLLRLWQHLHATQLAQRGQLGEAVTLFLSSLEESEYWGDQRLAARNLNGLGIAASLLGNVEEAITSYSRAAAIWALMGRSVGVGICHYNMGVVLREWGRASEANSHFEVADEYFVRRGSPEERVYTQAERALMFLDLGDLELASRISEKVLHEAKSIGYPYLKAVALRSRGAILLKCNVIDQARNCLVQGLEILKTGDNPITMAEVHEELAVLELLVGDVNASQGHLNQAIVLYAKLGSIKHQRRVIDRYNIQNQILK